MSDARVVALVAAHDEADRVAATVRALRSIPTVEGVVVADDGSSDATAEEARAAGALVLRSSRRRGKGEALEGALGRIHAGPDVWLLADADLAGSARRLEAVLAPVLAGDADLAIVVPPLQGGGFGLVKRAAGWAIRARCGFRAREPLSGQRAVRADALAACRPLAAGFGVEVAMTIRAIRAGMRVVEIDADVHHRPTGRDTRGFAHRGRQGWDIACAITATIPRRRGTT